jgi:metal-responsive CopG/Arc/MetJ family transcriptional regulator
MSRITPKKEQPTQRSIRLNITLPRQTVSVIDSAWRQSPFRSRSAFIDEAVRRLAEQVRKGSMKELLKKGYVATAERDRQLIDEWHQTSNGAWDSSETKRDN